MIYQSKLDKLIVLLFVLVLTVAPNITALAQENTMPLAKNHIVLSVPVGDDENQYAYGEDAEDFETKGPESFAVLNDTVYLLDDVKKEIKVFNLNSNYIKTIPLPPEHRYYDIEISNQNTISLLTYGYKILTIDDMGNILYTQNLQYENDSEIKRKLLSRSIDGKVMLKDIYDYSTYEVVTSDDNTKIHTNTSNVKYFSSETNNNLKQSFDYNDDIIEINYNYQAGLTYPLKILNDREILFYEEDALFGSQMYVEIRIGKYVDGEKVEMALLEETISYEFVPNKFVYSTDDGKVYQLVCNKNSIDIYQLVFTDYDRTRIDHNMYLDAIENSDESSIDYQDRKSIAETALMSAGIMYDWSWEFDYDKHVSPTNADSLPPRHLDENSESGIVTGIPYKWGGFDDMNTFLRKLDEGYTAGDINTTTVNGYSAGVDCSGYISRIYNFKYKLGTYLIPDYFDVITYNDILPGEICNKRGKHVVVFGGYNKNNGQIIGIQTLESTMDGSTDGVKIWSKSLIELQHFTPLKLKAEYYGNFDAY